jgi:hypothetical protein
MDGATVHAETCAVLVVAAQRGAPIHQDQLLMNNSGQKLSRSSVCQAEPPDIPNLATLATPKPLELGPMNSDSGADGSQRPVIKRCVVHSQ